MLLPAPSYAQENRNDGTGLD